MTKSTQPSRGLLGRGWRYLKRRLRHATRPEQAFTQDWDREWIAYFNSENPRPFLQPYTDLTVSVDLSGMGPRDVLAARLCPELGTDLHIYLPGNQLCGGRVFEVGCGPGLLCKQLGLIASKVVGIDYSKLALHIARLVSPPTCSYYHTGAVRKLRSLYGTFDCMACRHFFIHQNYARAAQVLGLARKLLRPGGLVGADFYLADPVPPGAIVFPARSSLALNVPSCAYLFSEQDVHDLAGDTGFRVTETWIHLGHQRRFTLLERQ
jgi:2-polyprenyl-3-methyl-5-hydroxy-6-metoxy-1,4-benzoquinol methylase